MARTHRSSSASDHAPHYFKHGYAHEDPNKVKKNGAGRHNWGSELDDIEVLAETGQFNFNHTRRRSNSSSQHVARLNKDTIDNTSAVFEE